MLFFYRYRNRGKKRKKKRVRNLSKFTQLSAEARISTQEVWLQRPYWILPGPLAPFSK